MLRYAIRPRIKRTPVDLERNGHFLPSENPIERDSRSTIKITARSQRPHSRNVAQRGESYLVIRLICIYVSQVIVYRIT